MTEIVTARGIATEALTAVVAVCAMLAREWRAGPTARGARE
jgi:hypothetical protein